MKITGLQSKALPRKEIQPFAPCYIPPASCLGGLARLSLSHTCHNCHPVLEEGFQACCPTEPVSSSSPEKWGNIPMQPAPLAFPQHSFCLKEVLLKPSYGSQSPVKDRGLAQIKGRSHLSKSASKPGVKPGSNPSFTHSSSPDSLGLVVSLHSFTGDMEGEGLSPPTFWVSYSS